MKTIEVVAAIIKKDDRIFITRRGYGDFANMWEFPGGKVDYGESGEEALIREIKEEFKLYSAIGELRRLLNLCSFFRKILIGI